MEQDIRFCTTSDGVRIAYASVGEGPPLVRVLGWFTHLELDWQAPWVKSGVEDLAQRHTYVRYDGRGMGLSDRDTDDFAVETLVRDLEAVVDASGHEKVALFAASQGGPIAITYAVLHPDRVSHLILYGSFAYTPPPRDAEQAEMQNALVTMVRQGWGSNNAAFRQTFTAMFMPDADQEQTRWFNELQRQSTSAQTAASFLKQLRALDVRGLLQDVRVPTLVFHARGDQVVPFRRGRDLAAEIPNARFVPLETNSHALTADDPAYKVMEQTRDEFLGVGAKSQDTGVAAAGAAGLVTILFTDMESSTSLTQRLGDAAAQEVVHAHDKIVRDALATSGGTEIKHTGDGIMASFPVVSSALEASIAIQRGVESFVAEHPGSPLSVYVGLNAGEPIQENSPDGQADLFGTSVQLARRICDQAGPHEILASNVVRELAAGKGFLFADRGETALRGFEDPTRLYEVRWQGTPGED